MLSQHAERPLERAALVLSAIACLFLPSVELAHKFGGRLGAPAYLVALLLAFSLVVAVERRQAVAAFIRRHEGWIAAVWLAAIVVAFLWLYPYSEARLFRAGSDRDDALILGVSALLDGRYPYYERVYRGDVLSPMPASLLLGLPFQLLGHLVWQNVFLAILLAGAAAHALANWHCRWLLVGLLSFGSVGFMQDYVTGGDYVLAGLLVGASFGLCIRLLEGGRLFTRRGVAAVALLGLAMATRPIYPLAGIVLAAHVLRTRGLRPALFFAAVSFGVAGAVTLPFLFYDPAGFSPLHVTSLLTRRASFLNVLLPVLAVAIACVPALRPVGPRALLPIFLAGLALVLGPAGIVRITMGHIGLSYLVPIGLLAALLLLQKLGSSSPRQGARSLSE